MEEEEAQKPDEECVRDERAGKRPSDLVEEKLQELLKGRPIPVSMLQNRNVRRGILTQP